MNKFIHNAVILTILFLGHTYGKDHFSEFGGGSTGGGNSCTLEGRTTLLDFVVHPQGKSLAQINKTPGISLGKWQLKSNEVKAIDLKKYQLYRDVQKVIDVNLAKSPLLQATLQVALEGMNVFVSQKISMNPLRAHLNDLCDQDNSEVLILFNPSLIIIDYEGFNQLSYLSQQGMIIHELLRQMQIRYNGNGRDEDLQDLTYKIVLGDEVENLDEHPFVQDFFRNFIKDQRIEFQDTLEVIERLKSINNYFNPNFSHLKSEKYLKDCFQEGIQYQQESLAWYIYKFRNVSEPVDFLNFANDTNIVSRIIIRSCLYSKNFELR